jgi:hypothetical protein
MFMFVSYSKCVNENVLVTLQARRLSNNKKDAVFIITLQQTNTEFDQLERASLTNI